LQAFHSLASNDQSKSIDRSHAAFESQQSLIRKMFVARYKQIVPVTWKIASSLIAILVSVSFVAILAPIAGASRDKSGVMACCIGKEAGHCDSGISDHKPPPPPPEPMCGLSSDLDAITIVAEPSPKSHSTRLTADSPSSPNLADSQVGAETDVVTQSPSVSKPCPMSCGACTATASRSLKRQKAAVQARTSHTSTPSAILCFENSTQFFSSNESWSHISPRGPPVTSLQPSLNQS
jgi:hypothetical protein